MADISECLSDTQEKPEASDVQVITHNKKNMPHISCQVYKKKKKKKKILTVEATPSKNKEIEKGRKTLVNSHATLTARLTEQWELRKHSCKLSPANSHRLSSLFDPGWTFWVNALR